MRFASVLDVNLHILVMKRTNVKHDQVKHLRSEVIKREIILYCRSSGIVRYPQSLIYVEQLVCERHNQRKAFITVF
uniref:Transposase n=1 Tax=Steinernema glaseri TaxID=37863 RepID=A0A1I7ZMI8_9BILA